MEADIAVPQSCSSGGVHMMALQAMGAKKASLEVNYHHMPEAPWVPLMVWPCSPELVV